MITSSAGARRMIFNPIRGHVAGVPSWTTQPPDRFWEHRLLSDASQGPLLRTWMTKPVVAGPMQRSSAV